MLPPVPLPQKFRGTSRYGADRGDVVHYGVDLAAKYGAEVVAPEDMEVIAFAVDDKTKPLTGYGPGAILARGSSGYYHVIGHMDPWKWSRAFRGLLPSVGRKYRAGELVGYVSRLGHVHWEVRTEATPARGAARAAATVDPVALVQAGLPVPLPRRGGGQGWVLLLLLLIASKRR